MIEQLLRSTDTAAADQTDAAVERVEEARGVCPNCPAYHFRGMVGPTVACAIHQKGWIDTRKDTCPLGYWPSKLGVGIPAVSTPAQTPRQPTPLQRTAPFAAQPVPNGLAAVQTPQKPLRWDLQGPVMWRSLHNRPRAAPHLDREREWMTHFTASIPCDECRQHWQQILAEYPLVYDTRLMYFDWTVAAHNLVNQRLGKRAFPLDDARRRHAWPPLATSPPALPPARDTVSPAAAAVSLPVVSAAGDEVVRRRDWRLAICRNCPADNFQGMGEDQNDEVRCKVGHVCCGGALSAGVVSAAWGECNAKLWRAPKYLDAFDRVVILHLARRPERLVQFRSMVREVGWPFRFPQVVQGVDGYRVPVPHQWGDGEGTWGCMQSHRRILEQAILDGVQSLLVLEDDAYAMPGFVDAADRFMHGVPDDWDGLMLGGQHIGQRPPSVAPGIDRCTNCQRTHAYAVRGRYMRELYRTWVSTISGHCDHVMGPLHADWRVYAPRPFLIGQRSGTSDISGSDNPPKMWNDVPPNFPVVLLRCPRAMFERLRLRGFHGGRSRDGDGIDRGLAFATLDKSWAERLSEMRKWIQVIHWESTSMYRTVTTVWHPAIDERLVYEAAGAQAFRLLEPATEDAAMAFLAAETANGM